MAEEVARFRRGEESDANIAIKFSVREGDPIPAG